MANEFVLAIDPGLLTGMLLADIKDPMNPFPVWFKEAPVEEFYQTIDQTIPSLAGNLEVVLENYIITARTAKLAQAPWSLRGYGAVQFLCMKYGVPFTHQSPSDAKTFVDNQKLHTVGFWYKGGEGHANDAARHFVKYHSDSYPKWTKKLLV